MGFIAVCQSRKIFIESALEEELRCYLAASEAIRGRLLFGKDFVVICLSKVDFTVSLFVSFKSAPGVINQAPAVEPDSDSGAA